MLLYLSSAWTFHSLCETGRGTWGRLSCMNQTPPFSTPLRPSPRLRADLQEVLPAELELVKTPAEAVPTPAYPVVTAVPSPPKVPALVDGVLWFGLQIYLGLEWLFGVVTLMVGLAF